jgi:hypothetical protein
MSSVENIIGILIAERDKLSAAIEILSPPDWVTSNTMKAAPISATAPPPARKKRNMSAATRRKMAESQRRRWAAMGNEAGHGKKTSAKAAIAEAIAGTPEDAEFKSKMSIAMAKSWAKRKAAAKKKAVK